MSDTTETGTQTGRAKVAKDHLPKMIRDDNRAREQLYISNGTQFAPLPDAGVDSIDGRDVAASLVECRGRHPYYGDE